MWLMSKKHIRSYNSPFPSIRCHFFRITPRNVQLLFRPERRVWTFDGKRPTVKNHLIHPDWKKHVLKRKHFSQRALRVKGIGKKELALSDSSSISIQNLETLFGIKVCFLQPRYQRFISCKRALLSSKASVRDACNARLKGTDMELRLWKVSPEAMLEANFCSMDVLKEANNNECCVGICESLKRVNRNCIMFNDKRSYWKMSDISKTTWIISQTLSLFVRNMNLYNIRTIALYHLYLQFVLLDIISCKEASENASGIHTQKSHFQVQLHFSPPGYLQ